MNDNRDIEDALRASLERHARQAPPADLVAERVIRRSLDPQRARGRRWQWGTWTLPVLASGAVAAVVLGVVAAADLNNQAIGGHPSGGGPSISVSVTQNPTASTSPAVSKSSGPNTVGLEAFRAVDLTFVGTDHGWALGTSKCLDKPGRCSAMVRTTDGAHWKSMTGPAADVGEVCTGANPCVNHIRFATDKVGYAFGSAALFMTTDGGANWAPQTGGAEALETLDNNVIRITSSSGSGCPGPCNLGVEISDIGSTTWTTVQLPGGSPSVSSMSFARGNGEYAYLLAKRNTAGGANDATSTLYRSKDNGVTWTKDGEPCPQVSGGEVDSTDVAGGDKGAVAVLCATRQAPKHWSVATSSNGGANFTTQPGQIAADTADIVTGDPRTVLVTGGTNGLSLSTDGGTAWTPVAGVNGQITFVGFESNKVGRAVGDHGATIWTTTDAGLTWSAFTFT